MSRQMKIERLQDWRPERIVSPPMCATAKLVKEVAVHSETLHSAFVLFYNTATSFDMLDVLRHAVKIARGPEKEYLVTLLRYLDPLPDELILPPELLRNFNNHVATWKQELEAVCRSYVPKPESTF